MRDWGIVLLLSLTVLLFGCGKAEGTPEQVFVSPLTHASPIGASPAEAMPTLIPDPKPDKGTIVGRLIDHTSGQPIASRAIYLGELSPIQVGETESHTITMLLNASPSTTTDAYGYFAFQGIEPGTYAMVIWTPVESWVVSDPDTKMDILITIHAGKITDLGEMVVSPPS